MARRYSNTPEPRYVDTARQAETAKEAENARQAETLKNFPQVSAADNGKILKVVDGAWALVQNDFVLSYQVIGDETYDVPTDSVTPESKIVEKHDDVLSLADIPTTAWTTSDGTESGVAGNWSFTDGWYSDTTFVTKVTTIENMKTDVTVYGKWTFTATADE